MPKRKSTWEYIRKTFNDIHLWLGLISGLFVFVICLSGTLYVYNTEIREWSNAHLYTIEQGEEFDRGEGMLEIDKLIDIVKNASNANVTAFTIPAGPMRSYQFSTRKEGDKSRSGVTYFINQYTGDVLGTSEETNGVIGFMKNMFSLHRWLLLDKIEKPLISGLENRKLGSYISGGMTILFTLGLLTGMVIWFPRKLRTWRRGLAIKFDSNWKRVNHDLHNTLAFYSFIFLLIMGLTGPQWSFDWYRTGLRKTLGTYQEVRRPEADQNRSKQKPQHNEKELSTEPSAIETVLLPLDSYIAVINETFPYKGDIRLSLPSEGKDEIDVRKYKAGFFAPAAANQLLLNVSDAGVKKMIIFGDKPLNERISSSIKALHIGDVYGQFSKLIYFITCLIATSLPVTGTLIWLNKMKKAKKRPSKTK